MKLFIDTANVEEIREIAGWGILSGVTTNPSLVAKEGRDFKQVIDEIVSIVDGPVSAEALSLDTDKMIEEARQLACISDNITVKIPMTPEGLAAVKVLSSENIKTNVTLIFSANQALMAANAGAAFVSPFVGRLDDISQDGLQVVRDIVDIFSNYNYSTKVITASVRHPMHVIEAALAGSDIATIPYSVFKMMVKHPLTDVGIERFLKDWETLNNKQ